jgi:hypothetical protein
MVAAGGDIPPRTMGGSLMSRKLTVAAAALTSTLALCSTAWGDFINTVTPFFLDFNLPSNAPLFGFYSQDNYSFSPLSNVFGNWIALGAPQFNADDTADIFQTTPGVIFISYNCPFPQCQGPQVTTFGFTSIGLDSATNAATGGQVQFLFTHPNGSFDTSTVTLTPGIAGLQHFFQ